MFEFEPLADLLLGLATGFGFLLQKGQVAKYQTILGQLLLKDWTTFKIMITAIVTAPLLTRGEKLATLERWRARVRRQGPRRRMSTNPRKSSP
jgi:hypothetical protein